jgi:hypothetical protein
MRVLVRGSGLALALLAAACGGSSDSPSSPTAPTSASGATVAGTVTSPGTSGSRSAAQGAPLFGGGATTMGLPSNLQVEVQGTAVSSPVGSDGRFSLTGVPAGDRRLRFTGTGTDATASLGMVQGGETVEVVVSVSGASAVVVSDSRPEGVVQVEGRLEARESPDILIINGTRVQVVPATIFNPASMGYGDLAIGVRVHVKGRRDNGVVVAGSIDVQNTNADIQVVLNGTLSGLSGTASAFEFIVNGRTVKGDAQTAFFGDGNKPDSFADLKDGLRVEVKGLPRDGYVYATRIHINDGDDDEDDDDDQQQSASIQGVLKQLSGTPPNLTFVIDSTTVRTSASTEVKRRGDRQDLSALRSNMTVHVVGDRRSDGSLDARRIEIRDDEVGGLVEISGPMGGLKGTCPSVTFKVNGFDIATNGSTTFTGAACSAFRNGDKVTVKGVRQASGAFLATDVKK